MKRPDVESIQAAAYDQRDNVDFPLEKRLEAQAIINLAEYTRYLEHHWWTVKATLDQLLRGPHD